ncbi:MAG: DUF4105 domain-containing protein [Leptospirales bacterium]|nr:DUF4105 domain-containing protein [Leptospirales bacterium]
MLINIANNIKYGIITVLYFFITFNASIYGELITSEDNNEKYILELISKSNEFKLSDDLYWRTILHYKKNFFSGYTSLVDDPRFFFAKDGKYNPEAELNATIRSFFQPLEDEKTHPTAKFTARFAWLRDKLDIDINKLPYNGETQFKKFYEEINLSGVTLVFPTAHMNSPASMYGHMLLLLEPKDSSRLLSQSVVNYAAITNEAFGPVYVFKGLFGFYNGYYSFIPYYKKIQEYSDDEMRDIWEYKITLTPEEIENMLRHIVEMENIYSDYYFIDENCSFNLLYLIEAAKPETKITDYFGIAVEPIDTIKALKDKKLIDKGSYRPSLYSKIKYLKSQLNSEEEKFVLDFCNKKRDFSDIYKIQSDEKRQAIIWDTALNYLKFLTEKHEISLEDYKEKYITALTKRSSLNMKDFDPLKDIPIPVGPEESHLSKKIAPEIGYSLEGLYSQISHRQSCHELMDPDEGYSMNSQIVFGNIAGRYYFDDKKFVLQRLDLLDLISLPTSDSFYFNTCYVFTTGLIQNVSNDQMEHLTYWVKGGAGLSTLLGEKVQIYLFLDLKSYFSPEYKNNTNFMGGSETGILTILGPWKNHMYAQIYRAQFGEKHTGMKAGLSERIKFTQNFNFECGYSINKDYTFNWHEVYGKFNFYF